LGAGFSGTAGPSQTLILRHLLSLPAVCWAPAQTSLPDKMANTHKADSLGQPQAMSPSAGSQNLTELLVAWTNGNDAALAALVPIIYDELRRLARLHMRRERGDHTLQTTALVHEAYLKLIAQKSTNWQSRTHFFAASAQSMRRILVDMARARKRQRRGGGAERLSLDEGLMFSPGRAAELIALDDALTELEKLDLRKSRVVELRFYGGLTLEEIADILKISPQTALREWNRARAWLYSQLSNKEAEA
jgi:RNA polymerase sigma-70 factor, ECF subfamily